MGIFNKNKIEYTIEESELDLMKNMYTKLVEEKELEKEKTPKIIKLNILGTLYQLKMQGDESFEYGGLVDFKNKTITINKNSSFQIKELYHEIIHAFLFESGLHSNCEWSQNEEMVDWFAMQFDKIIDVSRKGISCLMEKMI